MTELQKNYKTNVIDFLKCISSQEEQLLYKKNVPFVHIPKELIAQWDGEEVFVKNEQWFKDIWSEDQWNVLEDFEKQFEDRLKKFPKNIPDIPEILNEQYWKEIIELAKQSLIKLL